MRRSWRQAWFFAAIVLVLVVILLASRHLGPLFPDETTARSSTTPAPSSSETETAQKASLYISELMSAGQDLLADEDGECPDWVELFNSGSAALSLAGCHLSDNPENMTKWAFPAREIAAGGRLVVFLSGKDRRANTGSLHTNFSLKQEGEPLILSDARGIIIDWLPAKAHIEDVSYGRDPADRDRWLYFTQPTPGSANSTPGSEAIDLTARSDWTGHLVISEVLAANTATLADEDREYPDWIELYNAGNSAVPLSSFFLSADAARPFAWRLPDLSLDPDHYLLIFASGKNRSGAQPHTNFKISAASGSLSLRDSAGRLVDTLVIEQHLPDVSYGRDPADLARWLFFPEPTPGRRNTTHGFASLKLPASAASLQISEIMNQNRLTLKDQAGAPSDWIEIRNPSAEAVSLLGFALGDQKEAAGSWRFPDLTIKPGEHLLVFASGKNQNDPAKGALHTDFSLSATGERLTLFDPFRRPLDSVVPGRTGEDVSYGRSADGGEWLYFEKATPGKANGSVGLAEGAAPPLFSREGGFYTEGISLAMTAADPDAEIRYTLDGGWPTNQSPRYAAPLPIKKTTVVRAIAFKNGCKIGPTATATYFIGTTHVLPVVSLAMNPKDFDDPVTGIYSKGPNASSVFPYFGANYHKDIEVPAAFQLFEKGGLLGFQMDVGIKIFGGWTRAYEQKSLSIYARSRYESPVMTYPFLDNKQTIQFKHLVLRTGGQDVFRTKIRDILATRLMQDTGLDYQGYRQIVLYINGRYWGVYGIREKVNRYFFHYNHGISDLEAIDILEGNGRAKAGDAADYRALLEFIDRNDLSRQSNYEQVKAKLDIKSYIDYIIAMMYSANIDAGNNRFWRDRSGDGKWHWTVWDMDLGFGSGATVSHDTVWFMTDPAGTGAGQQFSTRLVRNLLKNSEFRKAFVERFAFHMRETLAPSRVIAIIDELAAEIEPEISLNTTRWERPASLQAWKSEVEVLRNFARRRPAFIKQHLQQHLGLSAAEAALFP